MGTPIYNPPVPYTGPTGSFLPGSMVRVQGRVLPTAHSLAINLQTGPGSYDDVALHINPRFTEQIIVRNSRLGGSWGQEERHGGPMPVFRDQNFEILILCEATSFKIAVNGQHFAEFVHRLQPLDRVNHLKVEGDLTISLIQVEGAVQSHQGYQASAPPIPMMAGGGGGLPYPPGGGGLPQPGFTLPPAAPPTAAYPPPVQPAGYPPPQAPYGGYPPPQQAQYGGYPPGGYAPQGQPGYYPPGPQQSGAGGKGGGLLDSAGKMLAGGLAGVGLASVANKIPGMGGKSHGGGYPQGGGYPAQQGHHGGGGGGMGPLGGILGGAAALGAGGLLANKAMKKGKKKNKLMQYGLPVGGALVGGYALKKGMKGFKHHGHSSSSSSSSSSEEE